MESSYGIGVTNRYDLFCMDDEASDPLDSILNRKAKQQKKASAASAKAALNSAEKENKITPVAVTPAVSNKGVTDHQKVQNSKNVGPALTGTQNGQQQKSRPIKETQNFRNGNDRTPREGQ